MGGLGGGRCLGDCYFFFLGVVFFLVVGGCISFSASLCILTILLMIFKSTVSKSDLS